MAEETQVTETKETTNDIIAKAIEDNKPEAKEEAQEKVETKEEKTETKEETKEEVKEVIEDLSPEEQTHALNLMRLIKNPETARATIEILAKQAGLIQTKEEIKETAQTVTDVLKEQLGDDLAFLAPKLGPAIEKIVSKLVEQNTIDIKQEFQTQAEVKVAHEVDDGLTNLLKDHEDAEELLPEIHKLMDKHQPSSDTSARDYFEDLYHIARGRKTASDTQSKNKEKVAKNRNDAPSRLASAGKGTTSKPGDAALPKMTLQQSIEKALEEVQS